MKTKLILFVTLFYLVFSFQSSFAQIPTYNLRAMNFQLNNPIDNQIEFDIYLERTNTEEFIYAGGQYIFNFNPAIANGGTLSYVKLDSDLPEALRPRNPTVSGSQLRLSYNALAGDPPGYPFTNTGYPGTKIIRMRLSTSASQFANVQFNIEWRNAPSPNPVTKINTFIGFTKY